MQRALLLRWRPSPHELLIDIAVTPDGDGNVHLRHWKRHPIASPPPLRPRKHQASTAPTRSRRLVERYHRLANAFPAMCVL